jgi:hypothetical protein
VAIENEILIAILINFISKIPSLLQPMCVKLKDFYGIVVPNDKNHPDFDKEENPAVS